ncbi:radical SAM protein [Geobacter pelophilus]|uniref:Radical SAM protein n=2 Tax=Geoanaerobacter pelophilus TaxID=60036 RepID=A0AAW4L431_9BACT|nr:radical SAM protein [Geoanaerobacter pelophilus]
MIVPFFISHHGCPHHCIFCDQRSITGQCQPLPSPEIILATIASYCATSPGKPVEVAFFGGTFTMLPVVDQQRLLAPLQPLLNSGAVSSVRLSTRPDAITAEQVAFLWDSGVRTVELGVQSLDDQVLTACQRGHCADDVRGAVSILRGAGLSVGLQLMPGLPCSSSGKDLATLHEAIGLAPDFLRIYPGLVLAGTALAALYRSGEFAPLSLEEAVRLCAAMLHRCMKAELPVIRIGLQASDSLAEPGKIIAGPYHPAFRQLVESELCYYLLLQLCTGVDAGTKCIVRCAPSRVSDVAGQHRTNLKRLAATGIVPDRIDADPTLLPTEIVLRTSSTERYGNLLTDLDFNDEGKPYV